MEVAPDVFRYNHETGMMDIFELSTYPEDVVIEAIKNCPKDCITWEVVGTKPA